jgi:endonuclease-3 related protein
MDEKIVEIYLYLDSLALLKNSPEYWWPNSGTFAVVVGAILTQNTSWSNVEKSLKNLEGFLELEQFVELSEEELKDKIRPSGFHNQKASRLLVLAKNLQHDFGDFQTFSKEVTREWLLQQKGIGKESADAILCYGCKRDVMVIDSYTKRLLGNFGITCSSYDAYKELVEMAVEKHWEFFSSFCGSNKNLFFCRFHGMFVEYNKQKKGKNGS